VTDVLYVLELVQMVVEQV